MAERPVKSSSTSTTRETQIKITSSLPEQLHAGEAVERREQGRRGRGMVWGCRAWRAAGRSPGWCGLSGDQTEVPFYHWTEQFCLWAVNSRGKSRTWRGVCTPMSVTGSLTMAKTRELPRCPQWRKACTYKGLRRAINRSLAIYQNTEGTTLSDRSPRETNMCDLTHMWHLKKTPSSR